MGNITVLKKLFDELIREEQRGKRFFLDASKYIAVPKAKRLLADLAREEEKHIDMLMSMRLESVETVGATMNAIKRSQMERIEYNGCDTTVYVIDGVDPDEISVPHPELFKAGDFHELMKHSTPADILKLAMKIEYDNVRYIVQFMKHLQERRHIDLLKRLANEEKQHFIRLKKTYDSLPSREQ